MISVISASIFSVAPLAGARIEMENELRFGCCEAVAPLAGARIEITHTLGKAQ